MLILTKIFREIHNPKVKRITAATVQHILLMQSTIQFTVRLALAGCIFEVDVIEARVVGGH